MARYSWDDANWGSAAGGPFTSSWVADDYAAFQGSGSYTITVNNPEANFGWQGYPGTAGATLTFNAAGSGSLQVDPASSTFGGYYVQGVSIGAGQTMTINAPITGTGGIAPTYSGTAATTYLNLYGNNTYSGATVLRTTYVWYGLNNNNSFGTGPIADTYTTSFIPIQTVGSSAITIPNQFVNTVSPGSLHLLPSANAPLVFTGPWSVSGTSLQLRNSGSSSVTISGGISGAAQVIFSSNGNQTFILGGNNTFSVGAYVGYQGNANVTLRQGSANAIPYGAGKGSFGVSNNCSFDLAGYNCNLNGFGSVSAGTIDNATGGGSVTFTIGNNNAGGTHSGPIKNTTGTLALVKTGTGNATLSSTASTYAGHTTVTGGGTLSINNDGSLGAVPNSPTVDITLDYGVLMNSSSSPNLNTNRTVYLTANGGYIEAGWGPSDPITVNGQITGPGWLAINQDGSPVRLVNTGNNWQGNTYVGSKGPNYYNNSAAVGWLQLGANNVMPNGAGFGDLYVTNAVQNNKFDTYGYSATVNGLWGDAFVDNTSAGAGSLSVGNNDVSSTFSGVIRNTAGTLAITKIGAGTLTLSGASTYTGGTTISAGTLEVSGSIAGNVTNTAGVLQLDNNSALAASATLALAASPAGAVNLNFLSGYQNVSALYFGAVAQAQGTWGALGNASAQHQNAAFTGTGLLNVSGAPLIVQVPQSMTTYTNCAASFAVGVVGSLPLSYLWSWNNNPISGATLSSYSLSNVQHANAGTYTCFISNPNGSTNSPAAVLTVLDTATSDGYANTILADGPMAYYRLDETSGATVAHDIVGNYNGIYNSVALGLPGFSCIDPDTAATFGPGPNSYVGSIVGIDGFAATTDTTAFTIEAWVNGPSSQTSGAGIITKGTGSGGEQFNLDVYGGNYRFFVRDSSGVVSGGTLVAAVGPNGTWQHVVAVYDGPGLVGPGHHLSLYQRCPGGLQVGLRAGHPQLDP